MFITFGAAIICSESWRMRDVKSQSRSRNTIIEHIMPQNENLSAAWRAELGSDWQQVHSTYLHTIGNLTLTGYNSELSDRPFNEKRAIDGGFDHSPLHLNTTVERLEHSNKDQIVHRGQTLAEKAARIWAAPILDHPRCSRATRGWARQKELARMRSMRRTTGHIYRATFSDYLNNCANASSTWTHLCGEELKQLYVAYKTSTNFVDIVPQKQRLRLTLNMRFDEIVDPLGVCRDITNIGRWGQWRCGGFTGLGGRCWRM